MIVRISLIILIFFTSLMVSAAPNSLTLQGRLIYNDIAVTGAVSLTVTVTSPNADLCYLYQETHGLTIDPDDGGAFSVKIGEGARTVQDEGLSLVQVFSNTGTTLSGLNCVGSSATSYTPLSSHTRYIYIGFDTGFDTATFSDPYVVNSVPYAIESERLAGKTANEYLQTTSQTTQVKVNTIFENTMYTDLLSLINGTSNKYMTSLNTDPAKLPVLTGTPSTPAPGHIWYEGGNLKYYDGASGTIKTLSSSSGTQALDFSTLVLSGDVSGPVSATVVNSVGGKTSAEVSQSVSDTLTASAAAVASSLAKRDASGNIQFNNIGSNITSVNQLRLYNGLNAISFLSPVLASSYTLTFPNTAGVSGQILTTDGFGILSWSSPSVGSVSSISGTANEVSVTGTVSSPIIGLADNGVTSGTYTKVTVDAKGRVSSGTQLTPTDVTNALGFTPADAASATSFTSVDLGSASATGTLATGRLPSLTGDVSSVSGSNIITVDKIKSISVSLTAVASNQILQYNGSEFVNKQIPTCGINEYLTFSGTNYSCVTDSGSAGTVTSVSGTANEVSVTGTVSSPIIGLADNGVTSGTYTKLTVDTKGRVSSGAQLTATDVTNALGFTPADGVSVTASSLNVSNTLVRRDGSGNFIASQGTFENSVVIKDGSVGGAIGLFAPTGFTSYNLTLPTTSGTTGQVLTTNGAGILSWSSPSTGSVTSVSGTANEVSVTGTVSSPIIGLADNGVTSGTYTKVTVDAKGRVSSGTQLTATDVTNALGFAPADENDVNNLVLLGDVSGTLTSNTVTQVGGKTATAIANIVDIINAATSFNVSGTVVRRDGSGNFNAGSVKVENSLILKDGAMGSEITLAAPIGFTSYVLRLPATSGTAGQALVSNGNGELVWSAGSSQWTTSGTNIVYNTGNVGIGVSVPTTALEVSGTGKFGIVQIGESNESCSISLKGGLRYNDAEGGMEFCNGVIWQSINRPHIRYATVLDNVSGTVNLNVAADRDYVITQGASTTLTISDIVSTGQVVELKVIRALEGPGSSPAIDWPAGTFWHTATGAAPVSLTFGTRSVVTLRVRGVSGVNEIMGFYGADAAESSFGSSPVTWNPADKSAALTLSNANKTTSTGAGSGGVRAFGPKTSGKWVVAARLGSMDSSTIRFGIGLSTTNLTAPGGDISSFAVTVSGANNNTNPFSRINNNSSVAFSPAQPHVQNSTVVSIILDMDNKKLWFAFNGIVHGGGDPAVGTGEHYSFPSLAGPFYPMAFMSRSAGTVIFSNAAEYGYVLPAGFQYWTAP